MSFLFPQHLNCEELIIEPSEARHNKQSQLGSCLPGAYLLMESNITNMMSLDLDHWARSQKVLGLDGERIQGQTQRRLKQKQVY
jgi:hypothetical protein